MVEFINEFRIKSVPERFDVFTVKYDERYGDLRKFGYKCASQVSRKLCEEMMIPIASLGEHLIATENVKIPPSVIVTMKIDGVPTDVEVVLSASGSITQQDRYYTDAARKYLNRQVDVVLRKRSLRQDGRGFFEEKSKDVTRYYIVREGINVASHFNNGSFSFVIDPSSQVRAKLNLFQYLKEELAKRGIDHWHNVGEKSEEISKTLRGRAYNLRSTYEEPQRDEPHHNVYRFIEFKFDKGIDAGKDPTDPAEFHRRFGRVVNPDQPIVEVMAQDGRIVEHVPELLEELPTPRMLKRFGASEKVHDRSLKDANTRYYMTSDLLKPLVDEQLVDPNPIEVGIENFSPVRITLKRGYIDIKDNIDFQQIFKKKMLLRNPRTDSIMLFSSNMDSDVAKDLVNDLKKVFEDFGLPEPKIFEKLTLSSEIEGFYSEVSKELASLKPTNADLVLIILGIEDEDTNDSIYNNLKKDSFQNLFPLQFVNASTIVQAKENENLRKGVANPLFLQIAAKCSGQPYGLQPGFVPPGTIFVGLDKYRQPFKRNAPTVISVTIFDSDGTYICGDSDILSYDELNGTSKLEQLLKESYDKYKQLKGVDASTILYLIDTGVGTMDVELGKYLEKCTGLAKKVGAEFIFACGNKGSHLRLYSGNPIDLALTAERVSAFSAATRMPIENEVLVVSTEPIISRLKAKEYGTPRAVLYTILSCSEGIILEDAKRTLAKSVVWLCRHVWISPASTREPAPIFFANKLSRLVAATGIRITPDRTTAPLFL